MRRTILGIMISVIFTITAMAKEPSVDGNWAGWNKIDATEYCTLFRTVRKSTWRVYLIVCDMRSRNSEMSLPYTRNTQCRSKDGREILVWKRSVSGHPGELSKWARTIHRIRIECFGKWQPEFNGGPRAPNGVEFVVN